MRKAALLSFIGLAGVAGFYAILVRSPRAGSAFAAEPTTQATEAKRQRLEADLPDLMARISTQVETVRSESLAQSLEQLIDVNMFFWPGAPDDVLDFDVPFIPLPVASGARDLGSIESNRRFLKVLYELSRLPRDQAGDLIAQELRGTLPEYVSMYNDFLKQCRQVFDLRLQKEGGPIIGPSFAIGNTKEHVIAGARLKVLGLVWLAGAIGSEHALSDVREVVAEAIRERNEEYADKSMHPYQISAILRQGSLYNRQILTTGLMGIRWRPAEAEKQVGKDLGLKWKLEKMPLFDALQTPYDLPVRSGAYKADFEKGEQFLGHLEPLDDAQFDKLVNLAGLK